MKTTKFSLIGMLTLAFLLSTTISNSQEQAKYGMVETVYIMPVKGKEKQFEKAVKLHNDTFHTKAPHEAGMNVIISGPETGWYVWFMGPTTFTDLDTRPSGEHDGDWNTNIDPLVKKYGKTEYWKFQDKLSHAPEGTNTKYANVWLIDLKRGSFKKSFKEIMGKVKAVYEKRTGETYGVYSTQFNGDDGRDVVILFNYNKWADLDKDSNFKKDFEAINGENSFDAFIKEWEEITPSIMSAMWLDVYK